MDGPGQGPRLKPGMVLAIEPMVNMGNSAVRVLDDGWTAITRDGSLSAHFEHTISIQPNGPARVLTDLDSEQECSKESVSQCLASGTVIGVLANGILLRLYSF